MPNVTVLMSCFNAAHWIDEAIKSVISQTYVDWEFVIVDDGSKDNTLEILRSYESADTRIHVLSKANTGLADSLNVGIRQARGRWIARLDADDVCEPTRLEKQVQYMVRKPETVFLGSGLIQMNETGLGVSRYYYPSKHRKLVEHLLKGWGFPPHSSAFFDVAAVRSVGGYRTRIRRSQDRDLWLRLSEVGQLGCLEDALLRIRVHSNQISNDEGGLRQVVDYRVALASYWLRMRGAADPVEQDDSAFEAFRAALSHDLEGSGLLRLVRYERLLQSILSQEGRGAKSLLKVLRALACNPGLAIGLLQLRLIGDRSAESFAGAWMKAPMSRYL